MKKYIHLQQYVAVKGSPKEHFATGRTTIDLF